jgi:response regulator of citrate/malate metabolism
MTKVVVVDDDFMVRTIHEAYVGELPGFEVVGSAATGGEALDLIARIRPDLVLLDVHLPDMTGIDVLHELRRRRDYVGIIVVTAERHIDFVRSALRGGASQYLIKPFSAAELHTRLTAFERSANQLENVTHEPVLAQDVVDRAFSGAATRSAAVLPKGLSEQSMSLIRDALREHGELSAADCAERTGMARVSTRRYLAYLVQTDEAEIRLQYGGGRPVKLYHLRAKPGRSPV